MTSAHQFDSAGKGISPTAASRFNLRQVENILYEYRGIDEVAVLCVPDAKTENKSIVAFVVPKEPGLSEVEIYKFLEQCGRLEPEQLPGEVRFVPRIPKSPSGKVLKMKLLEGCVSRD